MRTKQATVIYDPRQVSAGDIERALQRANESIAKAGEPTPAEINLLSSE